MLVEYKHGYYISIYHCLIWYIDCFLIFLNVERPSAIHLVGSEEKWVLQRVNLFLQTIESLPRAINFKPKFEFQTSLGAKISHWNLRIIFFLAPTGIFLGFWDSQIFLWRGSLKFSPMGFTILLFTWVTTSNHIKCYLYYLQEIILVYS